MTYGLLGFLVLCGPQFATIVTLCLLSPGNGEL